LKYVPFKICSKFEFCLESEILFHLKSVQIENCLKLELFKIYVLFEIKEKQKRSKNREKKDKRKKKPKKL
jgi:hypothetical protein